MNELNPNGAALTELLLEVFRANRVFLDAGDELAAPAGISSARWQVLGVVEHGASPVAHVARTMGLTRQSVQQTADGLVQDGFVEFADNPHHRRAKLLRITRRGVDALAIVAARQAEWANRVGGARPLAELRAAAAALREVRMALEGSTGKEDEG